MTEATDHGAAMEQEARELGWLPKEEFRGDASRWIPADQFVERGQHILPIVKENKERLQGELRQTKGELAKMQELLKASQESIAALEEHHQAELKRKLELARRDVMEQLKEAKREGDVDKEVELTGELTELTRQAAEPPKTKSAPAEAKPAEFKPPEEFVQWNAENKWFGQDTRRTSLAIAIGNELRVKGDKRTGRPFLEAVAAEVEATLGPAQGASKVEGSRGGARGAPSAGKTWHDLPADAKQACDGFIDRLVGPGRAYKTADEWRTKYTKDYFEE